MSAERQQLIVCMEGIRDMSTDQLQIGKLTSSASGLRPSLSCAQLIAYGLVFIVPIAPVSIFGIVFNASKGMVPLVYTIGLLAMASTARSYMVMSQELPSAGSVYAYASHGLGPKCGFLAGWAILLDYLLFPTLTYVACAIAVHAAMPVVSLPVCIVTMLAIVTLTNYFGIETTARVSFALLAVQLLILLAFIGCAINGLMHHLGGARLSLLPLYNPESISPQIIFAALSIAVLSFLGFDAISTLAEESKEGAQAVASATWLSLCLSAVGFIGQTWLASLFLLGRSSLPPGRTTDAAFYDIAAQMGGYWLKFAFAVPGILLAGIASAATAQTATARVLLAMARDGRLPRSLARVDPRRSTPTRALLVVASITLMTSLMLSNRLEFLTSLVSFGALVGFIFVHFSVIGYFVWSRKSRNWLKYLLTPVLGIGIVSYVLLNTADNAKFMGAIWMSLGAILLAVRTCLGSRAVISKQRPMGEFRD